MGEKSDVKLVYSIDGKELREISEIPDLVTLADDLEVDVDRLIQPSYGSFEFNISSLALMRIFMDEATLIRYCQTIKSNDWLKRHGLPMRRRGK
jgi:hypothetical protein